MRTRVVCQSDASTARLTPARCRRPVAVRRPQPPCHLELDCPPRLRPRPRHDASHHDQLSSEEPRGSPRTADARRRHPHTSAAAAAPLHGTPLARSLGLRHNRSEQHTLSPQPPPAPRPVTHRPAREPSLPPQLPAPPQHARPSDPIPPPSCHPATPRCRSGCSSSRADALAEEFADPVAAPSPERAGEIIRQKARRRCPPQWPRGAQPVPSAAHASFVPVRRI